MSDSILERLELMVKTTSQSGSLYAEARAEILLLQETIKRLNRRCQKAESGLAEKAEKAGPSLGRALANAECTRLTEENERLQQIEAAYRKLCKTHAIMESNMPNLLERYEYP